MFYVQAAAGHALVRGAVPASAVVALSLRVFASEFRRQAAWHGITTPDGTLGITLTRFLNEQLLVELLSRLPDGTWELCCHPACEDTRWLALGTRPGSGYRQLELFASAELRRIVDGMDVELISYSDLHAETRRAAA